MEKHVGQSSALQEIDRWSSCKFSTAGKHSVLYYNAYVLQDYGIKHFLEKLTASGKGSLSTTNLNCEPL